MAITLAQAQAQLDAWLAASLAVAQSQSYEITSGGGSRKLERADAAAIASQVKYWQAQVNALTPGNRRRLHYIIPDNG